MSDGTSKISHGTFRLCGHNPGRFVSQNADLKIDLHIDTTSKQLVKPQRFKIKMTITTEKGTAVHGGEHVVHQDARNKQQQQQQQHQHSAQNGLRQRPSRQPALPADMRGFPGIQLKSAVGNRAHHQLAPHQIARMPDNRQTIEIVSEESFSESGSEKLSEVESSSSNITAILSISIFGLLLGIVGVFALIRFKRVTESQDQSETK